MLELNKWFFVQLANFLILLFLLNRILFKPLLCRLTQRSDHIKNSLNSARAMEEEKEARMQEIEKKISDARNKAKAIFEEFTKEGQEIQKESIGVAQKEAAEMNRKARESLEAEVERVKESLRVETENFSRMIVEKLVGA